MIGVAELPLHQLRSKDLYHIWVPLQSPVPDAGAAANPYRAGAHKQRGTGLSQVSKPSFGKLRIRVRWSHGPEMVKPGDFPFKLIQVTHIVTCWKTAA